MNEPIRVLIADDQKRARESLAALLSTFALRPQRDPVKIEVVGEAADGGQAVELTRTCQPDVVLMDIQMPKMDGLLATRTIKEQSPRTCIILLTMYGYYDPIALMAGADAFLVKGCSPEELLQTIKRVVASRDTVPG